MEDNEGYNNYDEEEESPEKYPQDELHHNQDQDGADFGYNDDHKYLSSKEARKKAEEDSKLLANRIALLKLEERKAWK